jgi:hypothetical protein
MVTLIIGGWGSSSLSAHDAKQIKRNKTHPIIFNNLLMWLFDFRPCFKMVSASIAPLLLATATTKSLFFFLIQTN